MAKYTINSDHATLVAIDQHARSCSLSALDLSTGETRRARLSDEVSSAVEAEALKCNVRLVERYSRFVGNGKPPVVARTAIASEMVRDMWAIGLIVRRELGESA